MNATDHDQTVCNAVGVEMADVIVAEAYRYVRLGEYKVCIACPICPCGREHSITWVQAGSETEACDLARQRHLREVHGCGE